jgi:dihydrolipoamide dehydrogenase
MAQLVDVLVPDIGNFDSVDVIEVLVKPGDTVAKEDSLITVESDKASMDIPSAEAGVVKQVMLKVGDKVSKGSLILTLESSAAEVSTDKPAQVAAPTAPATSPVASQAPAASAKRTAPMISNAK